MPVAETRFGELPGGDSAMLYTLSNAAGVRAAITNFGAILVSLQTPDRRGEPGEITLGFDDLAGYLGDHPYFGATVGRFANRIAGARFTLDGKVYALAANDGDNHLHGGIEGFDKKLWAAEAFEAADSAGVRLSRCSGDGEEGYPGNLDVTLTVTLTDENELRLEFTAVTDAPTPVNLTNHTYFNLAGKGDVLRHTVRLAASRYTPVGPDLIPTGELASVSGTPLDFREPHRIGERLDQVEGGYDHNLILDTPEAGGLTLAARVEEEESGRSLEVYTTEPAVQFYTGNFLDGTLVGRGGVRYGKHAGLCLEPQKYPDSPNQPAFPSCILRPGERYEHTIVFRPDTL